MRSSSRCRASSTSAAICTASRRTALTLVRRGSAVTGSRSGAALLRQPAVLVGGDLGDALALELVMAGASRPSSALVTRASESATSASLGSSSCDQSFVRSAGDAHSSASEPTV